MLVKMKPPKFPMALGIIRAVRAVTYDELVTEQIVESSKDSNINNMDDLLSSGNTWEVN
jgi:2-oxoglutarate ferredoxin oxidoreductase subunit beta